MKQDQNKPTGGSNRSSWVIAGVLVVAGTGVVVGGNSTTAIVAPSQLAQKDAAGALIGAYVRPDAVNSIAVSSAFANTDELLKRCSMEGAAFQVPLTRIHNNPFSFGASSEAGTTDGGATEAQDADRITMLQQLGKLQLQSICASGDHPTCMIDGRLYQEGEPVACFTIERIGDTAVVIRNGEYRFELKIAG